MASRTQISLSQPGMAVVKRGTLLTRYGFLQQQSGAQTEAVGLVLAWGLAGIMEQDQGAGVSSGGSQILRLGALEEVRVEETVSWNRSEEQVMTEGGTEEGKTSVA